MNNEANKRARGSAPKTSTTHPIEVSWLPLGRTGTVAGCFLVELGHTPSAALDILHRVRSRNCPETRAQEDFIARYAEETAHVD